MNTNESTCVPQSGAKSNNGPQQRRQQKNTGNKRGGRGKPTTPRGTTGGKTCAEQANNPKGKSNKAQKGRKSKGKLKAPVGEPTAGQKRAGTPQHRSEDGPTSPNSKKPRNQPEQESPRLTSSDFSRWLEIAPIPVQNLKTSDLVDFLISAVVPNIFQRLPSRRSKIPVPTLPEASKVILLALGSISVQTFYEYRAVLGTIDPPDSIISVNAPGSASRFLPMLDFVVMPPCLEKVKIREVLSDQLKNAASTGQVIPPWPSVTLEDFLVSPASMVQHNFNFPAEYIPTQPLPPGLKVPQDQLMVALDCEMCCTADGLQLARVSIVDEQCKVLLDTLVKPVKPVTDYITNITGITAEQLDAAPFSFEEAQQKVLSIVHAETILVGHGLDNDLTTLKIAHRRVIDTSLLYKFLKDNRRAKLQDLAKQYIHEIVHTVGTSHDSIQDASLAMRLVQERIKTTPHKEPGRSNTIFELLELASVGGLYVDTPDYCLRWFDSLPLQHVHYTRSMTDEQTVSEVLQSLDDNKLRFIMAHLHNHTISEAGSEADQRLALASYNTAITAIKERMPPNTILVVMSTPVKCHEFQVMCNKKSHCKRNNLNTWTEEDERDFKLRITEMRNTFARIYYNPPTVPIPQPTTNGAVSSAAAVVGALPIPTPVEAVMPDAASKPTVPEDKPTALEEKTNAVMDTDQKPVTDIDMCQPPTTAPSPQASPNINNNKS
ncbi:Small RNA degrading nuclease 5 [Pelomyxa schiedti]|nr:Small RNA degrading nuclease 5 [Pelomyxa schiedti]